MLAHSMLAVQNTVVVHVDTAKVWNLWVIEKKYEHKSKINKDKEGW